MQSSRVSLTLLSLLRFTDKAGLRHTCCGRNAPSPEPLDPFSLLVCVCRTTPPSSLHLALLLLLFITDETDLC